MDASSSSSTQAEFDYLFKLLLIGDSGVGKSTLLVSFTSNTFDNLSPTIGVDLKLKYVTIGGKKLKLALLDTAGQEKFRSVTRSFYRGAHGIIMVYDVTRRETFTNLSDVWAKEIDLYSTYQDCIKMIVGNKVDKESERVVTTKEGIDFAREYGCLFTECSAKTRVNFEPCFEEIVLKESERVVTKKQRIFFAKECGCIFTRRMAVGSICQCGAPSYPTAKTRVNVEQCFEELVLKILETPSLLADGSSGVKMNIFKQKPPQAGSSSSSCCFW